MTGETRCRRAFPPTQNLISILEESLRDRLGNDQEQLTNAIVASWNATLSSVSPSRLAAKEAKFAAQSKASAALAILACVLDAATPLIALCLRHSSHRRRSYLAPSISALIALAAGALAVLSMRDGVHRIVDTSERRGPAIIILFLGAALRLLSCSGAGSTRSSSRGNLSRNERIGFRGEEFVRTPTHFSILCATDCRLQIYRWLESRLPGWSYENWTSKLRKHAGFREFGEPEWRYADFTYDDHSLQMPQLLRSVGVPALPQWSTRTRYHLEVKSTPAGCGANFFVSENQGRLVSIND